MGRFGTKLTVLFLCVALVPLLGYSVVSLQNLRQSSIESAENEMESIVKTLTLLCEAQEAIDRLKPHDTPVAVDAVTRASPHAWQTGDRFLTLRELLRGIRVGNAGYCFVLDSTGTFQVHPTLEKKNIFDMDSAKQINLRRIRDEAVTLPPGHVKSFSYPWPDEATGKMKLKLAKVGYFKPYDWIIVVSMAQDDAITPFNTSLKYLLGFLLATVVATVVLAVALSRYTIKPILQLTVATTAIAKGDFSVRLPVGSDDEIGAMAKSFGVMVRQLSEAHSALVEWSRTLEAKVAQRTMELEKAHERMLMHEKMASLGKLSAMVAHEINNPLSGVLSYLKLTAKLLGRETLPPPSAEKINQYLDLSAGEVKRCGEIVKNLLMFSKQSFGEFKNDSLNSIIEKSAALIKHSADMKTVALVKEIDPHGSDRLYCDSSGIQQMFVALMVNALDAMEKGGTLTVRTDCQSPTDITIQVADTGKGIPEDVLPHIFEPFFSFKESKRSIGMGLSVVYGIVQSHAGSINVESKVGVGTTFTIVVSRDKAKETAAAASAPPAAATQGEGA